MAARITQAEFARREGVGRSTVTRWIDNGRISPPGADGKLDYEQAHQERLDTESPLPKHQAAKAWHDADKRERAAAAAATSAATGDPGHANGQTDAQPGTQPGPAAAPAPAARSDLTDQQANLSAALKLETYKLQKAKAEQANLALDRDAGLLVERAIIEYLLRDLGEILRSELSSFADLHTPTIANVRGDSHAVHRQLDEATHATLERLADHLHRRAEQHLPPIHFKEPSA